MVLGTMLSQRDTQYLATRDDKGTWRILNTWHMDLREVAPDFDIPDDHPAVTLVTEGAFISLMKEATALGILDSALESGGVNFEDYDSACRDRDQYQEELETLKASCQDVQMEPSEVFQLSKRKLELIDKMTALGKVDMDVVKLVLGIGGNQDIA